MNVLFVINLSVKLNEDGILSIPDEGIIITTIQGLGNDE
jgi:hypothetical protein